MAARQLERARQALQAASAPSKSTPSDDDSSTSSDEAPVAAPRNAFDLLMGDDEAVGGSEDEEGESEAAGSAAPAPEPASSGSGAKKKKKARGNTRAPLVLRVRFTPLYPSSLFLTLDDPCLVALHSVAARARERLSRTRTTPWTRSTAR